MATNYTPILANTPATPDALNAPLQELDDAIEGLVSGDKEMTSPNIASFHNAAHDHTDAAGGGLLPFDALDASGASDGDFLRISGGVVVATPIAVDIPVGSFIPYGGASAPAGWLLCDGSAVSRTTYADLFSIIGVTYGSGDGSTTFNLPDLRGRVIAGLDNMGGSSANRVTDASADSLGGSMGAETHTLTVAEMPRHSHRVGDWNSAPSGVENPLTAGFGTISSKSGNSPVYRDIPANNGSYNKKIIEDSGGGVGHNNMQPTVFVNWLIKI